MGFTKIKKKADVRVARRHDRFPVISIQDKAIDLEKSDIKAWQRTLDPGFIVCKEGMEPTVFFVKSLLPPEYDVCYVNAGGACDRERVAPNGTTDVRSQSLDAFRFGFDGVEGLREDETIEELEKPQLRSELGSYSIGLTTGRFSTEWQDDLGKWSWRVLQARRLADRLTALGSEAPSTAKDAKDASSSSEDAGSTPDDSDSIEGPSDGS